MNNYALSEDGGGRKSYVRFNSRAGESVTLNNVKIDSSTMKELKDAVSCILLPCDAYITTDLSQTFSLLYTT